VNGTLESEDSARRARTRRLTLLLAALAGAIYVGYIALSIARAGH
jgi:hypothetical protein